MLDIFTRSAGPMCDRVSRRDVLRVGTLGAGALTLAGLKRTALASQAAASSAKPFLRDKSVVLLFLGGGPSPTPDAAFNKRWRVDSEDPGFLESLLTPEIRAFLLSGPKHESWAIGEGWLTCTWRKAGSIKELRQIAERAQSLLDQAEHALASRR